MMQLLQCELNPVDLITQAAAETAHRWTCGAGDE